MYKCVRTMTRTWQPEDNTGVSFLSIFTWATGWDSSPQDARCPAGPLKELVILGHRSIGRMNAINPRPAWPTLTVYKPIKVYMATFCQPLPLTDNYNKNIQTPKGLKYNQHSTHCWINLSQSPCAESGMVVHTYNSSTQEAGAGGP